MTAQPTPQQRGNEAEDLALAYLQAAGLVLIARNWRCRLGEIDLIMQQHQTLVFVEVRYRRSARYGGAMASITPAKQRKLLLTAQYYLQRLSHTPACRFDAVLIQGQQAPIWLQNIFF